MSEQYLVLLFIWMIAGLFVGMIIGGEKKEPTVLAWIVMIPAIPVFLLGMGLSFLLEKSFKLLVKKELDK